MNEFVLIFDGTKRDLCRQIAEALQSAHERNLTGAVGLRDGEVVRDTIARLDVVLVEQSEDLDSYGGAEPFTEEVVDGIEWSFMKEWLEKTLNDKETIIQFLK